MGECAPKEPQSDHACSEWQCKRHGVEQERVYTESLRGWSVWEQVPKAGPDRCGAAAIDSRSPASHSGKPS
eukprot:7075978-Alexandrium_andersonii.AAC.1